MKSVLTQTQKMEPLLISSMSMSSPSTRVPSTPTSPNSFTSRVSLRVLGKRRMMRLRKVVLPLPKNPVMR